MKKKAVALLLALVMALSLLPILAFAERPNKETINETGVRLLDSSSEYIGITLYSGMDQGIPWYDTEWGVGTTLTGPDDNRTNPAFSLNTGIRDFFLMFDNQPTSFTADNKNGGVEDVPDIKYMGKTGETPERYVYRVTFSSISSQGNKPFRCEYQNGGRSFELMYEGGGQQGGQQGGGFEDCGDSITGYELRDDGRRCLINGIDTGKHTDRPVELGIGWRESLRDVETIGISADQVQAMANANRGVMICGGRGITLELNDAILDDMAGKMNPTAQDMLWVRTDYRNQDSFNGKATAFRFRLLLNDTDYAAPNGQSIRAYIDTETQAASWVVYCPNDKNSELVLQNSLSVDALFGVGRNNDMTRCTISVKQGGMYVLAPAGYSVQGSWPWPGAGSVVWEPDGTKPANAEGVLKTLYDYGYRCPVPDNDVHFAFPSQLKRWTEGCGDDWDYDWSFDDTTGVVTIWVNGANQERWTAAVEAQSYGSLTDGVYYRFYFGSQPDEKPRTYGSDYYSDYEHGALPDDGANLHQDYHPNNGYKLAAVNRESKAYKLTGKAGTESVLCVLAMDNEQKTMNRAELRYAMRIDLVTVDSFNYKVASDNTVAAAKERITVNNFCVDNNSGNGWEARVPEDGTVFLRTNKTSVTMSNAPTRQFGYIADLRVAPPAESYQLVQWRESYNGNSGPQFPVHLNNTSGGDQTVFITWKNQATGNVIEETVHVETMNHATWMELLAEENTPVLTPDSVADSATRTLLEENGIYVSYDPTLGYFSTTVDASKLKDVSLLERGVTLTVPARFKDKAVSFKWQRSGGSENPATHGQDRAQQTVENLAGRDSIRLDDGNAVLPFQPFVQTQTLALDGLTVFYTDFQLYDGVLVQWLDENGNVLGYSYAYGRNGDFNTEVPTECLSEAPTKKVDKPTLVVYDDGLEFYCEKSPQKGGDGKKQFFRFSVNKAGHLNNGKGNEVYLPYAYFGITKEEGLQRAQDGKHPTISHYTDTYEISETIIGEYTEQGIKFVTKSFSPFVVDVSDSVVTPETPANIVYTVDENGVAQISSIDLNTNSGKTENIIELPEAESVVIAKAQFAKLAQDNKPAQLLLPVPGDGEPITITLNRNMLSALASDSNVSLSVISGAVDGNTKQQITAMERLPEAALVLNIDLAVGDVPVTTFAAGAAMQIETKYELPGGYDTVKVYCLKADGTKEPVSAQYSASTGKLVLSLPHLSTYVVEPVKTIVPQGGHSGYITTGHTITSDLKSVSKVTVDGVTVDSKYYTVSGGNVTLSETYLKTLTNGKHTVKLENDSYIATGEITVNNPAGVASAKTGDVGVVLYVGISLAAVLGSAAVIGTRKKEN